MAIVAAHLEVAGSRPAPGWGFMCYWSEHRRSGADRGPV